MDHARSKWFANNILVNEPLLRGWLARFARQLDVDDLIQETYARIVATDYCAIRYPKAFMFKVARNIAVEMLRRREIIPLASIADLEASNVIDPDMSQEQALLAREEIELLHSAIAVLPNRCRQVLTLRKIHGLSQYRVAEQMGLSESTVEKQVARGVRLCSAWFARFGGGPDANSIEDSGASRKRLER